MEEKLFDDFIKADAEEWRNRILKELKGKPIEALDWDIAGLTGKPFYTKEDLPKNLPNFRAENAEPEKWGARYWVNYQSIEVNDEKLANEQAIKALDAGATGILFIIHKAPLFLVLLKDILLPYCHIAFRTQGETQPLLDSFEGFVSEMDLPKEEIQGFIQGQEVAFSSLPNFKTALSVSNENDVTVQLAIFLGQIIDLVDDKSESKVEVERIFNQLQWNLFVGESYFEEIAKHRALRLLLAELANAYDLSMAPSSFQIASFSGQWNEKTPDEYNYLLRATTQAMSAIMGGTDALIIHPFSALFPKNPEQGNRIARNISTLLKEESYLDKVIDPAAGSYYVEALTFQIVNASWELLRKLEDKGGVKNLSSVEIQALIN